MYWTEPSMGRIQRCQPRRCQGVETLLTGVAVQGLAVDATLRSDVLDGSEHGQNPFEPISTVPTSKLGSQNVAQPT